MGRDRGLWPSVLPANAPLWRFGEGQACPDKINDFNLNKVIGTDDFLHYYGRLQFWRGTRSSTPDMRKEGHSAFGSSTLTRTGFTSNLERTSGRDTRQESCFL